MKVVALMSMASSAFALSGKRAKLFKADSDAAAKFCDGDDSFPCNMLDGLLLQWYEKMNSDDVNKLAQKNQCEGSSCQSGTLNLEALFGYGCWCFFGRIDSTLGRGPPIDSYDATCQKMALCYRCIFVDSENDGEDCDPFQTSFTATLSLGGFGGTGVSDVTADCQTDNQSACSWRTCACAMTMITSFFNLSFDSSSVYDDNLKHENGFDYNLECPQQGRAQDRQCCGFYPERRTYDRGEARDCCHEKSIYNPLRHVCCDDGTHIGIGNNCEDGSKYYGHGGYGYKK